MIQNRTVISAARINNVSVNTDVNYDQAPGYFFLCPVRYVNWQSMLLSWAVNPCIALEM